MEKNLYNTGERKMRVKTEKMIEIYHWRILCNA